MTSQFLVDIYVKHAKGPNGIMLVLANVSRDRLEAQSDQARQFFASYPVSCVRVGAMLFRDQADSQQVAQETHRDVTLPTGVPAALSKVLSIINTHKGRGPFYVGGLHSMTTAQRCYIWEACDILDLRNKEAWARVGADLNHRISHSRITPEGMRAIHHVFAKYKDDPSHKGKAWHTFVNQYVWETLQNKCSVELQQALDLELLNFPALQEAITVREEELRPKIMEYAEHQKENATRHKAPKHGRSEKKYQESREKLRRKHAEQVLNGERAYYAELEPYLQELKAERKATSPQ
ncbi:hypothetical protein DOTSEDRAFT_39659 [Dothistroma septosporum NZE10]|uniref:Uncharacterized protein n=1 Tax=Dothistroma septosporum (strain NZE10 / CBS 128990) TaxID=675120 RepID=M2YHZ9_DOTSN|nr:hypothetical protein DOTSEDRAFT_39659 [Dothistroma septosporum NZE10]